MKGSMMIGLIAGTCLGAVVATMSKPTRTAINKGAAMAKEKMQEMTESL